MVWVRWVSWLGREICVEREREREGGFDEEQSGEEEGEEEEEEEEKSGQSGAMFVRKRCRC